MDFQEKDLEDMIFRSDADLVRKKGLSSYRHDKVFRQFNLGAYGIPDMVGITTYMHNQKMCYSITVYELKKGAIDADALAQCSRYVSGLISYLKRIGIKYPPSIQMVLIGDSIDLKSNFIYSAQSNYELHLYTYSFGINGLAFKEVCARNYYPTSLSERGYGHAENLDLKAIHKELYRICMYKERFDTNTIFT
ncbi:hypothetical protein [Salmonirosea aquatica]|uniref:Uncharacterized protein n=1 Tax=Salmonirosea aquatica TaxID=2654236 RepID=A0A7C9BFZ8_9BACT|nr:hypothetical protein [Cytophagaceae bacterium SJW1-29]